MTFELLNELILSTVEQSEYTAVQSSSQIGFVNEAFAPALSRIRTVSFYTRCGYSDRYSYAVESPQL